MKADIKYASNKKFLTFLFYYLRCLLLLTATLDFLADPGVGIMDMRGSLTALFRGDLDLRLPFLSCS